MPAEIVRLQPIQMQPRHTTILSDNPEEQLARIDGMEAVRRLVELHGAESVRMWIGYGVENPPRASNLCLACGGALTTELRCTRCGRDNS